MVPSAPTVICAGLSTLDVVHLVDAVPSANQKAVARESFIAAGGPATNAAVAAARCGSATALITAAPEGPLTDMVRTDLAAHHVDLRVEDESRALPVAAIMVTRATGERAVVSPTASAVDVPVTPPAFDPESHLHGARAVLIDGYHRHLSLPLAWAARDAGIPVILDAGSYKAHTPELLDSVDIAVVSHDFTFPGSSGDDPDTIERLLDAGASAAVVTRGGGPMLAAVKDAGDGGTALTEVPVAAVEVVDTLGAGDFLHGALAHRIALLGWEPARLVVDLAWASRVVGVSLRSFGTRAWLEEALPPDVPEGLDAPAAPNAPKAPPAR
ncbi:PfkB family carbohydrate kinase [Demequina sediminicola]|uniref:PfkB family carbohydrate kinase n=1 Tax=Demequina sediminicola TaxID=1095026 RepID=UPI00078561D5|nr:PfkB family carbohydrate kinase [Demequina sediminicola]